MKIHRTTERRHKQLGGCAEKYRATNTRALLVGKHLRSRHRKPDTSKNEENTLYSCEAAQLRETP